MLTIDDYLNKAMKRAGLSARALGISIGVSGQLPSMWRTRRAWPSDDAMVKLARAADLDEKEALIHLNVWRTSGDAAISYQQLLKRIKSEPAAKADSA